MAMTVEAMKTMMRKRMKMTPTTTATRRAKAPIRAVKAAMATAKEQVRMTCDRLFFSNAM